MAVSEAVCPVCERVTAHQLNQQGQPACVECRVRAQLSRQQAPAQRQQPVPVYVRYEWTALRTLVAIAVVAFALWFIYSAAAGG